MSMIKNKIRDYAVCFIDNQINHCVSTCDHEQIKVVNSQARLTNLIYTQ
jgi:hypothetical protein